MIKQQHMAPECSDGYGYENALVSPIDTTVLLAVQPALPYRTNPADATIQGQPNPSRQPSDRTEGQADRVKIGFVGFVSYSLLPKVVRDLQSRFPAIEIDMHELTSQQQIKKLTASRIGVGIVRLPPGSANRISHIAGTVSRVAAKMAAQYDALRCCLQDLGG